MLFLSHLIIPYLAIEEHAFFTKIIVTLHAIKKITNKQMEIFNNLQTNK